MRASMNRAWRLLVGLAILALSPLLLSFLCFPLVAPPPSGVTTPVPAATFAPTVSANVTNPTPSAPSNLEAHLSFPAGSTLAIGATVDIPAGWGIAGDTAVTDGAVVGSITGFMTVENPDPSSLTAPGCNTTVSFDSADGSDIELLEATTDTGTKVSGTDTNSSGSPDVIDDANANGLPDGVEKYPAFLNTVLPGTHFARYFGHTEAGGLSDLYVNVIVIELSPGGPYRVVTIVNDPTSPPESATSRFCAPQSHIMTLLGTTLDNALTLADESGESLYTNPTQGDYTFTAALVSEFDHDNDSVSNGLDNCPFTANASQSDADLDFVGDACETDAVEDFDVDSDGIENGYDNCLFTSNAAQSDADFDDLGDACDPSTTVPNGPNYYLTCTDPVGIGVSDPGGASCVQDVPDPGPQPTKQPSPGDTDEDSCPDVDENGPDEAAGGRRDYLNPWDYFNPTGDGQNRVGDILAVVAQFGIDQGEPGYTQATDRTHIGPNDWNLGPPNGQQRVDDILHIVTQFGHDCP